MTTFAPHPFATRRLGPARTAEKKYPERWNRGQCMNGGCTRIGRYRDTTDCFRCWAGVKWTSVVARIQNKNGRCQSYVGTPLGFTREEFVAWVMLNPPPETMARPSIDRITPSQGYVPGNIRWLEQRINARGSRPCKTK